MPIAQKPAFTCLLSFSYQVVCMNSSILAGLTLPVHWALHGLLLLKEENLLKNQMIWDALVPAKHLLQQMDKGVQSHIP